MNEARSKILDEAIMTPAQILATAKNENNFIFRQGWVAV
jgi:hypothetical protein